MLAQILSSALSSSDGFPSAGCNLPASLASLPSTNFSDAFGCGGGVTAAGVPDSLLASLAVPSSGSPLDGRHHHYPPKRYFGRYRLQLTLEWLLY